MPQRWYLPINTGKQQKHYINYSLTILFITILPTSKVIELVMYPKQFQICNCLINHPYSCAGYHFDTIKNEYITNFNATHNSKKLQNVTKNYLNYLMSSIAIYKCNLIESNKNSLKEEIITTNLVLLEFIIRHTLQQQH